MKYHYLVGTLLLSISFCLHSQFDEIQEKKRQVEFEKKRKEDELSREVRRVISRIERLIGGKLKIKKGYVGFDDYEPMATRTSCYNEPEETFVTMLQLTLTAAVNTGVKHLPFSIRDIPEEVVSSDALIPADLKERTVVIALFRFLYFIECKDLTITRVPDPCRLQEFVPEGEEVFIKKFRAIQDNRFAVRKALQSRSAKKLKKSLKKNLHPDSMRSVYPRLSDMVHHSYSNSAIKPEMIQSMYAGTLKLLSEPARASELSRAMSRLSLQFGYS